MAPPTPSPRSTPTTPRHHSKTTNLTLTPQQSKHRLLHFPSPNPIAKAPAAIAPTPPPPPGEHPVEVIGRIRNCPADHRKDKVTSSVLEISGDGRSLRVRTDVGYRDFALDGVSLSEHEDLEPFYRRFVASRVEGVRLGAKCTIMMYGPTGSGKSHTMFGCPKQPGIVYMALRDILGGEGGGDGPDGSSSDAAVDGDDDEGGVFLSGLFVKVAVLEIYNEEIYDLLSGASNGTGGGPTVGPPKGNNTPKDSFEDDKSKILMILCASPDPRETHKTVSTLEYGAKAKCIVRVAHMPTPKEKVAADESSLLLRSRIVAMNQFIYKLQMENKLKEKECDDAHKKLLQKESELAELRAKVQLFEEREAEVKEEEINLKVGQRTKTLRLELMKMEDRTLQQQEELNMLRQRLEEVELERGKISGDVLQNMDGGSLMKRLEAFAEEQGIVKSMDLDMGDQQDSYEVKEIREDSNQLESFQKLSQLNLCLLAFEEENGANTLRFPDKVCLSTVFEGDEEGDDRESIEDEVDKEVVDEDMRHAIKINGLIPFVDSGLNGDHDHAESGSDLTQKHVGAEINFVENTRDTVSARKTRIQNIFRLCGNYRELAQQVKVSSPLRRGHQDGNRQSPLANGKEFGSKLGSKAEQSQLTPKGKFLPESPVMESPDSALLVPFASLQPWDEEKSTDQHSKRCVSSEPSKAFKENYSPGQVVGTDGFVDIYVKWEASKESSGNLIRKLEVSRNSSLADLRKLVYVFEQDPSGAPVAREKEARTQVDELPICNNQLNSHLACLRPIKKGIQKPDHVQFDSIENTLPIKKGIQKPDHLPFDTIENTNCLSEINTNCLRGLQV
ncbi:hypothetical protein B296_00056617 [Ensete ventricosum]|uniref:Kinesin motor domain-containing protein n=1 Tax=Ensete ventricosum TaxID=4639 RepID=A0A426XUJ3_ENSVE|nr:hypothetical protein B296_00056617 [Ensete ventricosum]